MREESAAAGWSEQQAYAFADMLASYTKALVSHMSAPDPVDQHLRDGPKKISIKGSPHLDGGPKSPPPRARAPTQLAPLMTFGRHL